MITVSPMDKHGYFSTGCSASTNDNLIELCKRIYVEENVHMPRVAAGPQIHISQVEAFCSVDTPLLLIPEIPIDEESKQIAAHIVDRIPDGACVQLGIGAVPNIVGSFLKNKKNLGIHTEMLVDAYAELVESGAVNNSLKKLNKGRSVATFALGSQKLYDWIDDNPLVQILPAEYVNNPGNIMQNDNVVSINACFEVDLWGQVCAESHGTKYMSGTGGQMDFARGAVMSKNGQSFICTHSTYPGKDGKKVSRIKNVLTEGAVVTTGKNDVDMIVTEYGIAKIRGMQQSERVRNLIAVAHPEFREELTHAARKRNMLF
jgi:acyl-CoA hydrolase